MNTNSAVANATQNFLHLSMEIDDEKLNRFFAMRAQRERRLDRNHLRIAKRELWDRLHGIRPEDSLSDEYHLRSSVKFVQWTERACVDSHDQTKIDPVIASWLAQWNESGGWR